ncbi:MAG: amidohydrolase family protein [Gemmatimonas sp.]|uniref:N-acyl-D-amino-acid deacylase family protein n=1 Tax=Gemmatimonas sp. TaxID=1962908 RepID=UPI0022C45DA6|nr:amidohydrolase family protein [Gemmatimonas sp.]MCZ8010843.1 amidohydrolase family protein [Gemmatimonas sp.]MCZ8266337.1 amidohydrolase family protein [Gemmatimonas sp.]
MITGTSRLLARGGRRVAVSCVALLTGACAAPPAYDVLLTGGTVVDGTGAAAVVADVAIAGDSIVAIGPALNARGAKTVVDVRGHVVAPGFWDNHAHLVTLDSHPLAENFIRQGITTILAPQHSQDQPFPLDAYMARVRMAPNVGLFSGHTWIRKRVMGLANRAPTPAELAWMTALVDSSMQQGALGLATGLEYTPAAYAEPPEIVALARVAATYGGVYVTHMRDEGAGVLTSVQQTLDVGKAAGIPVQINHLKVTGAAQWGWSTRILALLDSAAAAGTAVAFDVYPYEAYSTYSDLMFPAWALADGPAAFAQRVADGATRARLVREMRALFPRQTGPGPETIRFREVTAHPELAGRTLADYLDTLGQPRTVEAAVEALIALQLEGGFIGVFTGMDEGDIERFIRHPRAMFETDGDLVTPGIGYPHPRSYGSFPRVLSRYVRERRTLTLLEAVRRMTQMPAAWLAQSDRGTLAPGMAADVVVFHPDSIADRAQYTDPHHYADGVVHVLVNGTFVLRAGVMTGALPGRFLPRRRPSAKPAGRASVGSPPASPPSAVSR